MTRLLQHWFHEDHTFFIVVLRHPYATIRDLWVRTDMYPTPFCNDCGESALKHWLYIHETLFNDLKHIKNRIVFHYERFALGDTQGW